MSKIKDLAIEVEAFLEFKDLIVQTDVLETLNLTKSVYFLVADKDEQISPFFNSEILLYIWVRDTMINNRGH